VKKYTRTKTTIHLSRQKRKDSNSIAIEHKGQALSVLQLNLDTCTKQSDGIMYIYHDGRRSRKTNQSTIDFVKFNRPKLFENDKIFLGSLDNRKNISLSEEETQEFLLRVTSYALLRYELRELELTKPRKKQKNRKA